LTHTFSLFLTLHPSDHLPTASLGNFTALIAPASDYGVGCAGAVKGDNDEKSAGAPCCSTNLLSFRKTAKRDRHQRADHSTSSLPPRNHSQAGEDPRRHKLKGPADLTREQSSVWWSKPTSKAQSESQLRKTTSGRNMLHSTRSRPHWTETYEGNLFSEKVLVSVNFTRRTATESHVAWVTLSSVALASSVWFCGAAAGVHLLQSRLG